MQKIGHDQILSLEDLASLGTFYNAITQNNTNLFNLKLKKIKNNKNLVAMLNHEISHSLLLIEAVAKKNFSIIKTLLQNGAHHNLQRVSDNATALFIAAQDGDDNIFNYLLTLKEIKIDLPRKDGVTPLMIACAQGHFSIVEILLKKKANILALDNKGYSALHIAVSMGHASIVNLLLGNNNSLINHKTIGGYAPLHIACEEGRLDIVEILLKYQANLNVTTEPDGYQAIALALFKSKTDIIKYFLNLGFEINTAISATGSTLLHLACQLKQSEFVKFLLQQKADINAKRKDNFTPLFIACEVNCIEIVALLINNNAELNHVSANGNITPLILACQYGSPELVKLLLQNYANPNFASTIGISPLFLACERGNLEIVKLLIEYRADVNQRRLDTGTTPLYSACEYGFNPIVDHLIKHGADIEAKSHDEGTPLFIACQFGFAEVVDTLVRNGAAINVYRKEPYLTPLYTACYEGHFNIVKLLLKNNAKLNDLENPITPLHAAILGGNLEVIQLIVKETKCDFNCLTDHNPFLLAAYEGKINILDCLLNHCEWNLDTIAEHPNLYFLLQYDINHNLEIFNYIIKNIELRKIKFSSHQFFITLLAQAVVCNNLEYIKAIIAQDFIRKDDQIIWDTLFLADMLQKNEVVKYLNSCVNNPKFETKQLTDDIKITESVSTINNNNVKENTKTKPINSQFYKPVKEKKIKNWPEKKSNPTQIKKKIDCIREMIAKAKKDESISNSGKREWNQLTSQMSEVKIITRGSPNCFTYCPPDIMELILASANCGKFLANINSPKFEGKEAKVGYVDYTGPKIDIIMGGELYEGAVISYELKIMGSTERIFYASISSKSQKDGEQGKLYVGIKYFPEGDHSTKNSHQLEQIFKYGSPFTVLLPWQKPAPSEEKQLDPIQNQEKSIISQSN